MSLADQLFGRVQPGGNPPALNPYQWWFNGVTFGDGTPYDITNVKGLDDLPDVPQPDLKIDRDLGDYMGAYFPKGREIIIACTVHDTSDATFRADLDNLAGATIPKPTTEQPLAFSLPGIAQTARESFVRSHHRAIPIDVNYVHWQAKVEMSFYATDPRLYDVGTQSGVVGLPTGTGGTTWPVTWPLSWGTAAAGGTLNCVNAGKATTFPVLTITGPIDNPTVQNVTTGQFITFAITLGSTDVLTVDMTNRVVQLNGGGNLRGSVTNVPPWWGLIPGSNTVQFSANTTKTGSQLTVAWASAWV